MIRQRSRLLVAGAGVCLLATAGMVGYTLGDEEPAPQSTAATAPPAGSDDARSKNADSAKDGLGSLRPTTKSYGLYVGKNLTSSGDPLIAGSGEEVSGHWLEVVPRATHAADATVEVGVTGDAAIPGELMKIPQVRKTHKYLTMNYTEYEEFPAPLCSQRLPHPWGFLTQNSGV